MSAGPDGESFFFVTPKTPLIFSLVCITTTRLKYQVINGPPQSPTIVITEVSPSLPCLAGHGLGWNAHDPIYRHYGSSTNDDTQSAMRHSCRPSAHLQFSSHTGTHRSLLAHTCVVVVFCLLGGSWVSFFLTVVWVVAGLTWRWCGFHSPLSHRSDSARTHMIQGYQGQCIQLRSEKLSYCINAGKRGCSQV